MLFVTYNFTFFLIDSFEVTKNAADDFGPPSLELDAATPIEKYFCNIVVCIVLHLRRRVPARAAYACAVLGDFKRLNMG